MVLVAEEPDNEKVMLIGSSSRTYEQIPLSDQNPMACSNISFPSAAEGFREDSVALHNYGVQKRGAPHVVNESLGGGNEHLISLSWGMRPLQVIHSLHLWATRKPFSTPWPPTAPGTQRIFLDCSLGSSLEAILHVQEVGVMSPSVSIVHVTPLNWITIFALPVAKSVPVIITSAHSTGEDYTSYFWTQIALILDYITEHLLTPILIL